MLKMLAFVLVNLALVSKSYAMKPTPPDLVGVMKFMARSAQDIEIEAARSFFSDAKDDENHADRIFMMTGEITEVAWEIGKTQTQSLFFKIPDESIAKFEDAVGVWIQYLHKILETHPKSLKARAASNSFYTFARETYNAEDSFSDKHLANVQKMCEAFGWIHSLEKAPTYQKVQERITKYHKNLEALKDCQSPFKKSP